MNVSRALRVTLVGVLLGGAVTVLTSTAAQGAEVSATVVSRWPTSTWADPSPDPSGITYNSGTDQLIISDAEVEEIPTLYHGKNIFYASRTGVPDTAKGWTTLPWSNEPTGISSWGARLVISDDVKDRVFIVNPGTDGRWLPGEPTPPSFATGTLASDPEDVTVDTAMTKDGHIVVMSGANKEVVDFSAGPDGRFGTADDIVTSFDVLKYGARDPEGIEYDPVRDTLLVLDHTSQKIYELTRQGALLNTANIASASIIKAAGLTLAPASSGGGQTLYVVDRGLDNNTNPGENDGEVIELRVTFPPLSGGDTTPPTVTSTTPGSGATGVSRTANVTATFSEAVKAVNGTNFTLRRTSTGVKVGAGVSYNATTRVGTLNPNPTLLANTQYTVTLTGGAAAIRDTANNPLTTVTYTFTTGP
jgi:hypothetical protein